MKTKILLLLAFFFVTNNLLAQDRKLIESYKQPESSIMLFTNKTFAALTYITIIRGYYQKRPDGVYLLKPQKVAPKTIFVSECEKPSKRRIYQ
jgi:hypothetical protein